MILFLPVSSKLFIASITDLYVHLRLSRVTSSGKSSKKGLPIRLMERLVTCLWKVFCVKRPCSCWQYSDMPVSSSWIYSSSNCFRSLTISGPDSIQRRKALRFSVNPITPPEPFTILFSCSCPWSNGSAENLLVVFEKIQWDQFSNSSLILSGKDFMYRHPLRVINMIKGKEQRHECLQDFNIQWKSFFSVSSDEDENEGFILHDKIPIDESRTFFCMLFLQAIADSKSLGKSLSMKASCRLCRVNQVKKLIK